MSKSEDAARQKEIVEAAANVLVGSGLSALPYDLVAAEAGTTRQKIRKFYPDPDDLLSDLCTEISRWYEEILDRELATISKTKHLEFLLNFYFSVPSAQVAQKRQDDIVIDALLALSAKYEGVKEEMFAHYQNTQQRIAQAIKAAHPEIKPKRCDEIGFQIVCLFLGHCKMVASLNFSPDYCIVSRAAADRLVTACSA
ncbi:MAG: AcrR family transcriptional regulator [Cryomorphaceae bacterium]|jgi:AcrR family transcriptional regulator